MRLSDNKEYTFKVSCRLVVSEEIAIQNCVRRDSLTPPNKSAVLTRILKRAKYNFFKLLTAGSLNCFLPHIYFNLYKLCTIFLL